MSQMTIGRPFGKFDLSDELRLIVVAYVRFYLLSDVVCFVSQSAFSFSLSTVR